MEHLLDFVESRRNLRNGESDLDLEMYYLTKKWQFLGISD